MAYLDAVNHQIVIRIVYAGAPMSGKTASIQCLDKLLLGSKKSSVSSPWEAQGRTLYFDWLDYTAGIFQDYKVRSQLISVAGQKSLSERRKLIIDSADVIVFVADSRIEKLQETQYFFNEMQQWLKISNNVYPIAKIVQANKADLENLSSPEAIKEALGDDPHLLVIPASAHNEEGIRTTFVMAVNLALARLSDMLADGVSLTKDTLFDDDNALLHYIEQTESVSPMTQKVMIPPAQNNDFLTHIQQDNTCPPLPLATQPNNMIWPCIAGKIILHELTQSPISNTQGDVGSWTLKIPPRWKLFSDIDACYADESRGLEALASYRIQHENWQSRLSEHRCYALIKDHLGYYRIWQIVRRERDLRFIFERIFFGDKLDFILDDLFDFLAILTQVFTQFSDEGLPIPSSLEDIGWRKKQAQYFGFFPQQPADYSQLSESLFIQQCLTSHRQYIQHLPQLDIQSLIRLLRKTTIEQPERQHHADLIAETLISS